MEGTRNRKRKSRQVEVATTSHSGATGSDRGIRTRSVGKLAKMEEDNKAIKKKEDELPKSENESEKAGTSTNVLPSVSTWKGGTPEFCLLPEDDPRVAECSWAHPPSGPGFAGVVPPPEVPKNLFFTVDGVVTMPVFSLSLLRSLAQKLPPPSESNSEDDDEDPELKCDYCGLLFRDKDELVKHMMNEHKVRRSRRSNQLREK